MNAQDYETHFANQRRYEAVPYFTIDFFKKEDSRTLLYGYTCDRLTHHAYVLDRRIILFVYDEINEKKTLPTLRVWEAGDIVKISDVIPDKRLYPSACDFEMCKIIAGKGVWLPFTSFEPRESNQFYGRLASSKMIAEYAE